MAVFRIDKTRDYTVMSNHHLRNTALSLKAKGLLSLMLSWNCQESCSLKNTQNSLSIIVQSALRHARCRLLFIPFPIFYRR